MTRGTDEQITPRDLTTRALTVRAKSVNEDERSVEAVIATETRARVFDWNAWEIIEEIILADGARFGEQVVLLETHQAYSLDNVLGSIRQIRKERRTVVGQLVLASDNGGPADRAWEKIRQGHLTDVSAGYRVLSSVRIEPGQKQTVNGKIYKAGEIALRITTEWELVEGSLVPIGADEAAKLRASADGAASGRRRTDMAKNRSEETRRSAAPEELDAPPANNDTAEGEEERPSDPPARRQAPRGGTKATETAPAVDEEAIRAEARVAERRRCDAINKLAGDDTPPDLLKRAIEENWTVETAGMQFREHALKTRTPAVTVTDTQERARREGMKLALCVRAGVALPDSDVAAARPFMHLGLKAMARMCLAMNGVTGELPDRDLWKRSISTGHLPEVLGDSANKVLHQAYQQTPSVWRRIAAPRPVSNFKTQKDLKVAYMAGMETLGPGGKIPLGYLTESKETYQIGSKGRAIAISFEQFVNDDLGAFLRLPVEMGQAVARAPDEAGFALLAQASGLGPTMGEDSQTLFYASRTTPNYYAHATDSGINFAGLSKAKELLAKITDPAGSPIDLTPRFLMCPPELEVAARQWTGSTATVYTTPTSGAASFQPTMNVFSGMAEVIAAARLSALTNGTTAWYLIADPAVCPTFVLAYLDSIGPGPKLDTYEMQGYDNLVWQVLCYLGVGVVDWRGVIRMKGAA